MSCSSVIKITLISVLHIKHGMFGLSMLFIQHCNCSCCFPTFSNELITCRLHAVWHEVSTTLASSAAALSHVQTITLHQDGWGKRDTSISVPLFNLSFSADNHTETGRQMTGHTIDASSRLSLGRGAHNGSVSDNMRNKCICLHARAEQLQLHWFIFLFYIYKDC